MSLEMDHRFVDRVRRVREDGARRRLRWGIAIVAVATVIGGAVVAFRSPLLAVRRIEISGAAHVNVAAALDRHGVAQGVPTISVRASELEDTIESDPWVARAEVRVTWPGAVDVTVLEHIPSAWMQLPAGWMLVSATGAILERGQPPLGAPTVQVDAPAGGPGGVVVDRTALAGLEFLASLPAPLARDAVVTGEAGELGAVVAGHAVDLGSSEDMTLKAAALVAILDAGLVEGAVVSLLSPNRPATTNPQLEVDPLDVPSSSGTD